jgi:cold shock CspA family protein
MEGKVKSYDWETGYGTILSRSGHLIAFHKSIIRMGMPKWGSPVEVVVVDSDKGVVAKEVFVKEDTDSKAYIKLGDMRIRFRNIIDYGIETEVAYYQKVYEKEEDRSFLGKLSAKVRYVHKGRLMEIPESRMKSLKAGTARQRIISHFGITDAPILAAPDDLITNRERKYLYIVTLEDKYYKFKSDKVDFDLSAVHAEISDFFASR